MTLKAEDFDRIARKLQLQVRDTGDRHAWFVYAGKKILPTKRSHIKGRDLPFAHHIRQQLKLTEDQFRALRACPLDRAGVVALYREKGIIPPDLVED